MTYKKVFCDIQRKVQSAVGFVNLCKCLWPMKGTSLYPQASLSSSSQFHKAEAAFLETASHLLLLKTKTVAATNSSDLGLFGSVEEHNRKESLPLWSQSNPQCSHF